jgi:hypothetical protein
MIGAARFLRLVLLPAALVCAATALSARAADPAQADPEDGSIVAGAYVNRYFGLRYPLPSGWTAGELPPPASVGGYYVLATPTPPKNAGATILFAAQDMFFAAPPLADAGDLAKNLMRYTAAGSPNADAVRSAVTIAGRPFVSLDLPAAPLSRVVFAADIRCHVVIFAFAAADRERLAALAASLDRLSLARDPSVPACVKGYASAQTIRRKVAPAPAGPQSAEIPVRIVIAPDGSVAHIHVVRATAAQKKSIEDALRQWRFAPYRVNGQPRAIETGLGFALSAAGKAKPAGGRQ